MEKYFDPSLCGYIVFKDIEWKLINNAAFALRKTDLARELGVSITYVNKLLRNLLAKAYITPVIDYRKIGLANLVLFLDPNKRYTFPIYTNYVTELREMGGRSRYKLVKALVPYDYLEEYISYFDKYTKDIIIGHELNLFSIVDRDFYFTPRLDDSGNVYLVPAFNGTKIKREWLDPPTRPTVFNVPDPIDLAIISMRKTKDPFMRATTAVKLAMKNSYILSSYLENVKHLNQHVAYHFKEHFPRYWLGNTALIAYNVDSTPPIHIHLKGEDHYVVARALSRFPFISNSIVGENSSIVMGYLVASHFKNIVSLLYRFEVDWKIYFTWGYSWQGYPKFYEYVEKVRGGWRWTWREEITVTS